MGVRSGADRAWLAAGLVGVFTLSALALHLFGYSSRPLWSDEAATYWTVQAKVADILRGARTDGTPPLHFLLVSLATALFGWSEIVLRLPSLFAACLLIPAAYLVARRMATTRIAVIAAGLCALSPLVHYYSVEARNYSLVQFETLVILYAAWAAVTEPDRVRWWALLVLAHAVQLWTHNYSLFLLPVLPMVCLVAGGRHRVRLAAKALSASGLAFALYIPWFLIARQHAALGIADWIVPFWLKIPPMAAIPRSLEVFGFGGSYPSHLSYLGTATPLRVVSLPLTAVLLTAAGLCRWSPTSTEADSRPAKALLLAFVALPLAGAWVSSLLFEPLYMVGRYDTIVLPVFLIVFAVGIDCVYRWRPIAGSAALALTAALGIQTHWTTLSGPVPDDIDRIAAYNLASEAAVSDPIIATGYRRLVVAYYLDRLDHRMEIRSYPPEVGEHPGWYSAARLLSDRTRLAREAQQLSESVQRDAAGRRLWLLISPRNDIDTYLDDALMGPFSIDEERTHRECGLICLMLPTLAESSE